MPLYLELAPRQLVTFHPYVGIEADDDLADDIEMVKVWMGIPCGVAYVDRHRQVISHKHSWLHLAKHEEWRPCGCQFNIVQAKIRPNTLITAGISIWQKTERKPIVLSVTGIVPHDTDVCPHFVERRSDPEMEISFDGLCPILPEDAALASTLRWMAKAYGGYHVEEAWNRIKLAG
jgi:hypothetical protein